MSKYYDKLRAADGDVDLSDISSLLGEARPWFRYLNDREFLDLLYRFDPDYELDVVDNKDIRAWAPFVVIGPPPEP